MQRARPIGRGASARKYDILTALGAFALTGSQHDQKRVLRLMLLITGRYNWQRDRLAVGQREIAAMWNCDERTVKREMSRFRSMGWLIVVRQGARGRVTEYSLDFTELLKSTETAWSNVGPDFVARLSTEQGASEPTTVVPLPVRGKAPIPPTDGRTEWDLVKLQLHSEDEAAYAAWIHALVREGRAGGILTLRAPSRFHASYVTTHLITKLVSACQRIDDEIESISVIN